MLIKNGKKNLRGGTSSTKSIPVASDWIFIRLIAELGPSGRGKDIKYDVRIFNTPHRCATGAILAQPAVSETTEVNRGSRRRLQPLFPLLTHSLDQRHNL